MKSINATRQTLILALFVMTPFLVTPITYELFEFPKMMFVYIITIALGGLSLTGFILAPDFEFSKISRALKQSTERKVGFGVLLFVGANLLSGLSSIYPHTVWWGYYSRFSGGLFSIFCYAIIFFILKSLGKERLQNILKTLVWVGGLVSIYGIAQHFGLERDRWVQDVTARVFSSFGQPNWLAAFLVLVLPLNLSFLIQEKLLAKRATWYFLAIINFAALWFTFSLSGIIAFAVCFLLFVFFLERNLRKQNWLWLALFAVSCLLTTILQPGLAQGRFEDVVKTITKRVALIKPVFAAATSDYSVGDTGDIRLIVWQGILKEVVSSPHNFIIGTGPETVAYTFLPFRPAAMNQTSEGSFLYNKAHNYFLDLLSNTGIIGLGIYLLLNFYAVVVTFKKRADPLLLALGIALVGNSITNFFGWPTVVSTLVFFLYLAVIDNYQYD